MTLEEAIKLSEKMKDSQIADWLKELRQVKVILKQYNNGEIKTLSSDIVRELSKIVHS